MGFSARQGVRWAVRYTTCHVYSPLRSGTSVLQQPSRVTRRCYSSPGDNPHTRETPSSPKSTVELSLRSLLDMGFTDTQAGHIYDTVCKIRGGSTAKHAPVTLSTLFALGLNPSSVLKLLQKCPEIYTVGEPQLRQRIANLRKLGLVEASLQRIVAYYPQILTVKTKNINSLVLVLKEKCLFTSQHVTDILRDSPAIIQEDLSLLEYKFQYVYFRMGLKQPEMVKSRLFRFTLDEVRNRHCFLERRGMYETPDKKGQTTIVNPKLSNILSVDQNTFVAQVANATSEEFDIFQRLMVREWQEEDHLWDYECVTDDESEEEEENKGKMGYKKRKKR